MFRQIGRDNFFLMLALLLWAFGEGMWLNLRTLLLKDLGATAPEIGLAGTVEAIGRASLLIPAGLLVDRIGPRAVMIAGWLIGMVSIALMAISPTWQVLTITLALYATTIFVIPAISAYAVMAAPPGSDPQRTLSLLYVAYPIGQIISPTVGGILADQYGIRTLLWLALVTYAFSTVSMLLTRHVDPHPHESDFRFGQLLGNAPFMRYALFFSGAFVTIWVSVQLLPLFLEKSRGLTNTEIGGVFSILSAGAVVLVPLISRTARRAGFLLMMGIYFLAIIVLWQVKLPAGIAAIGFGQVKLPAGIAIGAFLIGAVSFLRPSTQARLEAVIRPHERGVAFGGMEVLFAIAGGIASAAAGLLFDMSAAHDLPLIASLVTIPLIVIGWFALRIAPSREAEPAAVMADPVVGGGQ